MRGEKVKERPNIRRNASKTDQPSTLNPQLAFTLIELLIVIGIIGILAGMLLPVLARIKLETKIKQTRLEMKGLEAAILQYDATYGHLPAKTTGAADLTFGYASAVAGVPANSEVMTILMDANTGVNLNHVMNPQGVTQFSAPRVSDTNSPGFSQVDYQLRDLWGHPYIITLDLDGNKRCRDAFYSATNVSGIRLGQALGYNGLTDSGNGFFELSGTVMIWSLGPDGQCDNTAKANAGLNRDNILSWQ